jgi:uncharacterized membrane protein
MPFCSQCGTQVEASDTYCAKCGAAQPVASSAQAAGRDIAAALSPRTASILCYIPGLGWIASIIVLAAPKFRRDQPVRFHAFQGLYLFVAYLVNSIVIRSFDHMVGAFPRISSLVELVLVVASVFMIVKVAQGSNCSLPLFGELAARSAAEE